MTVGWYVHHHGAGHLARLRAVAPSLPGVVALSSLEPVDPPCPWIVLPRDDGAAPEDPTAGGTLHWVPRGHAGLRDRMARLASWIAEARPSAFVVDVSVEVAVLARLLGVPTVVIVQRGRRDDAPHALAYAQAAAIAAPWTAVTHAPESALPAGRLHFCGALSRLDGVLFTPRSAGGDVALLLGAGGHGVTAPDVSAAAAATPDRRWHVAGPLRCTGPGVVDHGPHADIAALLERCSVVVGSAGGNVVAEVAAARRAFVCLPQDRPFSEQEEQAAALARLGVAEVRASWPAAGAWPETLAAAEARELSRWGALHDGHGARRLADVVARVAAGAGAGATAGATAGGGCRGSSANDPPAGSVELEPPRFAPVTARATRPRS